jgi:large subunit ribosomal protein L25
MRKDITIVVEARKGRGKNEARRLRATGRIPAVVYGAGRQAVPISVSPKEIDRILYSNTGHNTIFNVDIGGAEKSPVMVVDWQHDPVKGDLLHVDLERIDLTRKISVKVPVHTEGDAKGVKQQDGLMEIVAREIEIECLPDDIPEHFVVDVRDLLIGQNLRAGQVPLGEAIKLKSPSDAVICHVIALRTSGAEAEVEEEAAAEETPEPEVIKKGKKEEEDQA